MDPKHIITAKCALLHLKQFYDEQHAIAKQCLDRWPGDNSHWEESLKYWSERKVEIEECLQAFRDYKFQ